MPRYSIPVREMCKKALEVLEGNKNWIPVCNIISKVHQLYPKEGVNEGTIRLQLKFHCINDPSRFNSPSQQWLKHPMFKTNGLHQYMLLSEDELHLFEKAKALGMEVIKRRYYDVSEMVRQVLGEAPIVPKEICREVAEESDDEMEDAFSFSFTMEEQLKNSLSKNLDQLEEGLRLYSTEFAIPKGRIDILAIDKDENFVVIETKLGLANDITQILSYINQIKQDIAKGKKVRGIIIASSFSERIKLAIGENPIKLKRYKVNFSFEDVL